MSVAAETSSRRAPSVESRGAARSGPLRLEVAKLRRQSQLLALGWLVVLAPVALVAVLSAQSGTPADTLFGRWVHESGLAIPLVVMGFAGQWVYPVLAGLVAGDIFSAEDRHGTWKLLHTRSHGRASLFAAKALVGLLVPVLAALLLVASSLVAGLALVGDDPIIDLSGALVGSRHGTTLVLLSLATQLPMLVGMAALALVVSLVSRSSVLGIAAPVVVGLGCQLVSLADLPPWLREVLPSGGFTAWRMLWTDQAHLRPVVVGAVSGAVLTAVCLGVAAVVFGRRDVVVR